MHWLYTLLGPKEMNLFLNRKHVTKTVFNWMINRIRETDRCFVQFGIYPWKLNVLGICSF